MRSAQFDKVAVLRAAMQAFLSKGYTKTSMQDLKQATGLHPGSIYCAFENKRGLLLAAIAQYNQDRSDEFCAFFINSDSSKQGLAKYLDHIVEECLSCDTRKACLLTKALNELAEQDDEVQTMISQQLESWQTAITDKFARAQNEGDISMTRSAECRGRYFVMGIYGLRTFANTHPEPETLKKLATQLFADVCA
jgi:AcrR family transcriptional regulator